MVRIVLPNDGDGKHLLRYLIYLSINAGCLFSVPQTTSSLVLNAASWLSFAIPWGGDLIF